MQLLSLGAAGTVTGSMHLLRLGTKNILIDAGLFQGNTELEDKNTHPFPFDIAQIDAVLLTHGHLDHVGRLPLLTKAGYRGPIYCTLPTAKLAEIVMLDAAHIQAEQEQIALKQARRQGQQNSLLSPFSPLYDKKDVHDVISLLVPTLCYDQQVSIAGLQVTPYRAGHILGSASLLVQNAEARVLFSGDLGNRKSVLQRQFTPPPLADVVVLESTYATSQHRPFATTLQTLKTVLLRAVRRGGKILVPVFAIERAQTMLYLLRELMESGEIPYIPVFLDSPMARKATDQYRQHGQELQETVSDSLKDNKDPFDISSLHIINTRAESQRINKYDGPAIILAGNGMMSGGRIQHHLRHQLGKSETTVLIVSYQSSHSLGGQILAGAREVTVLERTVEVKAHVEHIGGLSAHADQDDLLAFLAHTSASRVWLTHGEQQTMSDFLPVLDAKGYKANMMPFLEWTHL